MKKIFLLSTIVFGLFAATSCDDHLDINQDPNSPDESNITSDILLPAAEINLATSYGDYLRIVGGYFSQHYAQQYGTSNYLDYSQFEQSATRSSGTYTQLNTRVLKSLKTIAEKAEENEEWGTFLAAKTLKAFTYQVLVDCYGEVPFTEAFDAANVAPKYDDGQDIYAALLAELDEALEKVSASDKVAKNFLYPNELAANWIKFANAEKLRLLIRESGVVDVKAQLAALIEEDNLPTADVAYAGMWGSEQYQANPFFSEEFSSWKSQENLVANVAIVGTMQQSNYTDPRLAAFFNPNDDGNYTGAISGTNFSTTKKYKAAYWCRPVSHYDDPVVLIPLSEIEFFKAEYYARYGSQTDAQAHYEAAIEASFDGAGVDGADTYLAQFPYDAANYAKSIGVAKWVALSGVDNFEAWCELRRLNYPAFGSVQSSDLYGGTDDSYKPELYVAGTLYTPYQVFNQVGENKVLERFPYAESSSARNGNTPKFPGYTEPVFWAK